MKKFCLLLIGLLLFSCEDTEFNDPAFEGLLNNTFWDASSVLAIRNLDGTVTINASRGMEQVSLRLEGVAGTYTLGPTSEQVARYSIGEELAYSTSLENGTGEVIVENINEEFISGTFSFLAVQIRTENQVFMQQGTFFQIPFVELNEVQ